ncbi:hypothetical protein ES702_02553 [subsurface metagenome]
MKKPKKTIELAEKRESQELSLPKVINSEVNLLVFPFFALSTKGLKKKLETEYRDMVKRGNQKIEILWNVSANPKYGYPGFFDRNIHKVIEQIITQTLRKNGKVKNPIVLGSLYNLCKRMGINNYGGSEYKEIKRALERIKATTIKSIGTFYSKEGKQWIDDTFSLYDRIVFKGKKLPNGEIADSNYLFLGSWYLQSLNSFYIKPIDYNYLQNLKRKIASRLYEILGVKFYGLRNKRQDFICYRYSKLCQLLPITPFKQISRAKQQLDPAHKELRDTEFLFNYEWDEDSGKDWLIYYWPGRRVKKEMSKVKTEFFVPPIEEAVPLPKRRSQPSSKSPVDLVNQLIALNVSETTAKDLVEHSSQQVIRKWIKGIHYTNAKDKGAYLVKAIRENWQAPEEYLKKKEEEKKRKEQEKARLAEERKEKEQQKRKQKEAEKLDKIYNSLNPLQQKEVKKEIKNRLSAFWRKQLEREMENKEISKLTKSALESKKREVIKDWIASGKVESENSKV